MRGLSSCTEDDEALISENFRGTCSLGNRVVHLHVEGKKQVEDNCAYVDICKEGMRENRKNTNQESLRNEKQDFNNEKTGQLETVRKCVNVHENSSIGVFRESTNKMDDKYVKTKERETSKGNEDIKEVNGNVTEVDDENNLEHNSIATSTEEPESAGVPLLMPLCVAGLALAIPLSIYLVTRQ